MIKRISTLIAAVAAFVLVLSACAVEDDGGPVTIARANWSSGYMQAAIYAQLIEELGYEVTDPAAATLSPYSFYPALAAGQYDLWANGWFPPPRHLPGGRERHRPGCGPAHRTGEAGKWPPGRRTV